MLQIYTITKKEYVRKILFKFFQENKLLSFEKQVFLAQKTKLKRPLFIVLKQRFLRLFNH